MSNLSKIKAIILAALFPLIILAFQNCTPSSNQFNEANIGAGGSIAGGNSFPGTNQNGDGYTGKVKYVSHPVDNPCFDGQGKLQPTSVVTEMDSNLYFEKRNCERIFPELIDRSTVEQMTSDSAVVKISNEVFQEYASYVSNTVNENSVIQSLYCSGSVAGSLYSTGELVMTLTIDDNDPTLSYDWRWDLSAVYADGSGPYVYFDEDYSVSYAKVGSLEIFNEDLTAEEEQRIDLDRKSLKGTLWGSKILRDTGLPSIELGCIIH